MAYTTVPTELVPGHYYRPGTQYCSPEIENYCSPPTPIISSPPPQPPFMPPAAWRTYSPGSLANRFLGWICKRSGRWKRDRRHNFLLCAGGQTHGFYQMATKGSVANVRHFPTNHLPWSDRQFWSYRQWALHQQGLWETQALPHLILTATL